MSLTMFNSYCLRHPEVDWECPNCVFRDLSTSYFEEAKVEGIYDNEFDTSLCSNSELNLSLNESLSVNDVGVGGSLDWFNKHINSYYKSNLKIAHLNVNSIFGKSDEVLA